MKPRLTTHFILSSAESIFPLKSLHEDLFHSLTLTHYGMFTESIGCIWEVILVTVKWRSINEMAYDQTGFNPFSSGKYSLYFHDS